VRKLNHIDNETIRKQWDISAEKRFKEISTGTDLSYRNVLMPYFEASLKRAKPNQVLDAGCGVGFIAKLASSHCSYVAGVDLSPKSIKIAQDRNCGENVEFICSSIETFNPKTKFDFIVANMTLMDCVDHKAFITSCSNLLNKGGKFVATITNPFYWPRYWQYEKKAWFTYNQEIHVEAEFSTSSTGLAGFQTIHTHRPLSSYVKAICEAQLTMSDLSELSGAVQKRSVHSKYPRYIALEGIK